MNLECRFHLYPCGNRPLRRPWRWRVQIATIYKNHHRGAVIQSRLKNARESQRLQCSTEFEI